MGIVNKNITQVITIAANTQLKIKAVGEGYAVFYYYTTPGSRLPIVPYQAFRLNGTDAFATIGPFTTDRQMKIESAGCDVYYETPANFDAIFFDGNRSYTDTDTSTTGYSEQVTLTVSPTGNSTRQVFASNITTTYNSAFNMTSPGYVCADSRSVSTAGAGTHAKVVCSLRQFSAVGGNVTNAVGQESSPLAIGAGTTVGSYASFYTPNVAAVANINNINLFYGYANDHYGTLAKPSLIKNTGLQLNGSLNELSPAYHPGLVANRYYSAASASTASAGAVVAANTLYLVPVLIPHRCLPSKLGINITVAAVGNVVLGLYNNACTGFPGAVNGVPNVLISQTAATSSNVTGIVELALPAPTNGFVDNGSYWLVALFSSTPTVSHHTIASDRIAMLGTTNPLETIQAPFLSLAYSATLPAALGALQYSNSATTEPKIWFRI